MGKPDLELSLKSTPKRLYGKKKSKYEKQCVVIDHLFAIVIIATYENQLMYDLPIQIQCDVAFQVPEDKLKPVMQLSVLITDLLIETANMMKLCPGSLVTVSDDKSNIRRNVFTCVSTVTTNPRTPVLYGQDFYIRLYDSQGPELYLTGNIPHLNNFGKSNGKITIGLTDKPDRFSKFRIVDTSSSHMIDLQGSPVQDHPLKGSSNSRRCVCWKFMTEAIDEDAGNLDDPSTTK